MPEPTTIQEWLKYAGDYGIGFVFLAGFTWIGLWALNHVAKAVVGIANDARVWLPKVVNGHIEFLETTKAAVQKTAAATETMSETHSRSDDNHRKTQKAISHVAAAQQKCDIPEPAKQELQRALDILE